MRRMIGILAMGALLAMALSACGSKEDVEVALEPAVGESSDAVYHVVRMMASLLKERPERPDSSPPVIMTVQQGDQVTVLERYADWSKVRHQKTGEIGWLHTTFLQIERRSRWWSGNTEKARRMAKKIYQDKSMTEHGYPIVHVSIDERFNKLVFETRSGVDFPREKAEECAATWIPMLIEEFPDWGDHNIFLTAREKGTSYTLVMSDDLEPTFL